MKSFAMIRFHALGPWLGASVVVAAIDLLLPPVAAICVLQVVIQLASFRWLHARRIASLTALLVLATILPGLMRFFINFDTVAPGSYADVMFAPIRVWVSIALGVAMLFQADLQRVRKRRLELRRELQRKVRRRSAQITRINEALRREVARRQATQTLLTRTETHLQSLAQRMQLQVLRKDSEGVITYANEAFCKGVGKRMNEVIGSTDFDLYPAETAEKYRQDDSHVMQSGVPVDHVESHPTSDGKTGWVQVFKAPEYDEHDDCIGIQMVFWDVTDTYRRTAELRRSEARKRALFDAAREAVMLVDDQGRIVEANPSAEMLFAGSTASLAGCLLDSVAVPDPTIPSVTEHEPERGTPTTDQIDTSSSAQHRRLRWQELPTSERREMSVRRHDGWTFPAEISVHPIPLENSQGLAVFVRDVTLRHQAIRALRDAKRVAEEANRTKSEFMAGVSHEIRTPLGGILGSAALLARMELPPRAKQYVEMIRQSGDLLAGVIGDILDFASIEAGRFNIDPAPTDLHLCVGEAFRCLATRASGKDLELVLDIKPDVPRHVLVDAKRLRQIVINLASNAIKFTPRGHVLLRMSMQTPALKSKPMWKDHAATSHEPASTPLVAIEMIDSGIGIAKELQDKIFEPFEQGDSGTTRRYGGTGLGLSISQQLIKHMGGQIEVVSRPGHGSTFRCLLPLPVMNNTAFDSESVPVARPEETAANSETRRVAVDIKNQVQRAVITDILIASGYRIDRNAALRIADHSHGLRDAHDLKLAGEANSFQSSNTEPRRVIWLARVDDPSLSTQTANDCVLLKPVLPDDLLDALHKSPVVSSKNESSVISLLDKPEAKYDTAAAHLLVVDDSEVNRTVIHDFLALAGFRAQVVSSGAEAIVATGKCNFDCVLMDLQMPEMDGVETMRQIARQCRDLQRPMPPVIALTAHATDEHRRRCLAAGMKSFLVKPIDATKLIDAVATVTGKRPTEKHLEPAERHADDVPAVKPWQRKMLASAGNDQETMRALAEAFVIEVPQLCESLTNSLAVGDLKTARRAAHTLKSCLKYVAPTEDHQCALEVEMAASLNDLGKAQRLTPKTIQIAERWVRQVESYLNH